MMSSTAAAQNTAPKLLISGPESIDTLSEYTYFFVDKNWDRTIENMVGGNSKDFEALKTPTPDFGFEPDRIWLRINLENQSENWDHWYLHTHENFLQYYDVFIQRESGRIDVVETHNPKTPFRDRSVAFSELASQFNFLPGETISLFIVYSSGGSTKISYALETEQSFSQGSLRQISKNFISYGMMLILIVAGGFALLLLRMKVFLAYSAYVTTTMLFLVHADGVAFQYLWPGLPTFNSYFSIIVGLAFTLVPYDFSRVFLRTREFHPRLNKLMIFMMIFMPVVVIPGAFIDPQATKKYLMVFVLIAISTGTFAGFVAARKRFKEVRFYLFAWLIGGLVAMMMNVRHFTDIEIMQHLELDGIRVAIVVDAIMMGLGVADRYRQQMAASREEERRALRQAEQNLILNTRLQALEERYTLASELVMSRDTNIKNTVHDLRQPLHALRLNVKNIQTIQNESEDQDQKFEDTFSYLETLISGILQDSVQGMPKESFQTRERNEDAASADVGLSKVLNSVYDMFLSDAEEKGLEFRYVKTSLRSSLDSYTLMRMISNLVSNAIKYTSEGKILLGVRRIGNSIQIEVHDTGIGLSEDDFVRVQSREVRLNENDADGEGLGLTIVRELASQNDCEFLWLEKQSLGTSVALRLAKP